MGFFNVLKGEYPGLKQLDKTLPLGTGATVLVRGSLMYVDPSTNKFIPAAANQATQGTAAIPGAVMYWALQNADDPDVKMANGITGLPCTMPMEVETDQFDTSSIVLGSFVMGGANAKLTLHTDGLTACGRCTKAAYTRWSNNAVAVAGVRTGNRISVISLQTMYAPSLSIS